MDFSKLPPSLLVALGLTTAGCTRVTTCLSIEGDETGTAGTDTETSTSACLSPATDSSATDFTTGPCLIAPQTTSSTGTETDTDTDTETGTATDGTTVGPCLEPPFTTSGSETDTDTDGTTTGSTSARAPSRASILDKLAGKGILPPDVTRRLRTSSEEA